MQNVSNIKRVGGYKVMGKLESQDKQKSAQMVILKDISGNGVFAFIKTVVEMTWEYRVLK
jgi:hypothetical protein